MKSTFRTLMAGLALAFAGVSMGANYQDADLKPTYGSVKLKSGFKDDPYVKDLEAGGPLKQGKGRVPAYIGKEPDFILEYEAGKYALTIYAESSADTTLLIKLPDGTWVANDDGPGTGNNPLLRFQKPQSGKYTIWVGTIGAETAKAKLKITELKVGK